MNTLVRSLAAVALSVGGIGLAQNAAALDTNVQFSSTGDGVYDKTAITSFDWADNQSVVIEQTLVGATGDAGFCPTLGCFFAPGVASVNDTLTFNLHGQARLGLFSNALPNEFPTPFQVTTVFDLVETARVSEVRTDGTIIIEFIGVTGTYTYYSNPTTVYSQTAGTGFTAGTAFLTGNVVSTEGTFTGPNGLGAGGTGSSFLRNTITSYDSDYIEAADPDCADPGTCLVGSTFDSTLDLTFGQAPSLAVGGTIGATPYVYVAGDLLLAADATSQFSRIPLPGTTLLLGLGLLGMAAVRRRKS